MAAAGAATLHAAIAPLAALFPSASRRRAASRVASLAPSRVTRARPSVCRTLAFLDRGRPKATRDSARLAASVSARSPIPISRMQWCNRPGPNRACAISNPRPSPSSSASRTDTTTSSNVVSACPCGASSYPNTGNGRTTLTPFVRVGTSTIVCWRCLGTPGVPSGVVFPMKIASSHRGSHAPLVHHFRPLSTYESPTRTMELVTFVASDDATAGSVMAKHDRIVPRSSGRSHRSCCASVPYRRSTSMFPVSGAEQLKNSDAHTLAPMHPARCAYSKFVRPGPRIHASTSDSSSPALGAIFSNRPESRGSHRFQSPAALASALSSSTFG
mmetsp:Transcript_2416/g.9800  ORF Transcript_2416/g.9800 Transcript_2416/m.9800 type:complete len:329 (+) Transcript_2416:2466-3452(+)